MSFEVAMIIGSVSGAMGFCTLILVKPEIKRITNKKYPKHICNLVGVIGVILYISFVVCLCAGKHQNPTITYKEVPIKKLTMTHVYFDDNNQDLGESYVIIEEPNRKYNNIVLIETETYTLQWIYKIKLSGDKYHVYLTEDCYKRLENGNVIYESEK